MLATLLQPDLENTPSAREALATDPETQRAIHRTLRLLLCSMEVTTVALFLTDADGEHCWTVREASELSDSSDPAEIGCCRMAMAAGDLLAIEDTRHDPRAKAEPALRAAEIGACLATPLPGDGEPQGALCLLMDQPRPWSALQRACLTEWAALVAEELEHQRHELERERVLYALRVAEECVTVLCSGIPSGVVLRDLNRSVLAASPALAASLGYAASEMVGMPAMELLHPDDRLGFRALHQVTLLGDRNVTRTRVRYLHKDGSTFPVWVQVHVIRGPKSEPRFTVDLIEQTGGARRRKRARTAAEEGDLLPICSFCKKVRTGDGEWESIENFLGRRYGTAFTHGLCELCQEFHYGAFLQ